jgi:hypothetical protein
VYRDKDFESLKPLYFNKKTITIVLYFVLLIDNGISFPFRLWM